MRVTVLGGRGGWPGPDQACGGYLVEAGGHRILLDPGYGTVARLQRHLSPAAVDAVVVSHGHPDHCADLNALARARAYGDEPCDPLPVYAPAGAVDRVLALDDFPRVAGAVEPVTVADGDGVQVGPLRAEFAELPHHVTNLGVRLTSAEGVVAHTGDSGPDPAVVELGRDADVLLIEATYPHPITDDDRHYLCDVGTALRQGVDAGASRLLLTHLWPTVPTAELEPLIAPYAGLLEVHAAADGGQVTIDER